MNEAARTHSLRLSPTLVLVAVPGRCWLTAVGSSELTALPASALAARRASVAASLIEGAIAAGLAPAANAPAAAPPCTLLRYVRWLAGNYVFAGQTPSLFRRAAERFEALGRGDLAEFARKKADEESGHADLAYWDIESLGLPAAEVIRLVQPPSAEAFAQRFRAYVDSSAPIALFGFSYCLERMAVERDHAFIRAIEAVCPPQSRAFRFLKVHSNIGSDSDHVDEQMAVFESFTATELNTVALAAYETAALLADQPAMDHAMSEEEIERRLRDAGIELAGLNRNSSVAAPM